MRYSTSFLSVTPYHKELRYTCIRYECTLYRFNSVKLHAGCVGYPTFGTFGLPRPGFQDLMHMLHHLTCPRIGLRCLCLNSSLQKHNVKIRLFKEYPNMSFRIQGAHAEIINVPQKPHEIFFCDMWEFYMKDY